MLEYIYLKKKKLKKKLKKKIKKKEEECRYMDVRHVENIALSLLYIIF